MRRERKNEILKSSNNKGKEWLKNTIYQEDIINQRKGEEDSMIKSSLLTARIGWGALTFDILCIVANQIVIFVDTRIRAFPFIQAFV